MTLTRAAAAALLESFAARRVLVLGDVMLDEYLVGRVDRISPEAPVPIVQFQERYFSLGGAANVAHNIRVLGGAVDLIGLTGDDEDAGELRRRAEAVGIDCAGLIPDPARYTTKKLRIVTARHQQVARVDYEGDRDTDPSITARLAAEVGRAATQADAIVVSDYLKGTVSRDIVTAALAQARLRGTKVLVDPKIANLSVYKGVDVITPNHHEAELATHVRIRQATDADAVARTFQHLADCGAVVLTLGELGMWVHTDGSGVHLPARAHEVADVTGAGDTVISTLGLALASGAALLDAADLANRAAGIAVLRFGAATVSREEVLGTF
jgi:D-beta-D-heptose 7-phosphate kinase/D-beta-D-heptose 1-phosphate adenosyltransferase